MPSMNTEQTGLPDLSAKDEIGVPRYGLYEQRPVHSPGDYLFLPSTTWLVALLALGPSRLRRQIVPTSC